MATVAISTAAQILGREHGTISSNRRRLTTHADEDLSVGFGVDAAHRWFE